MSDDFKKKMSKEIKNADLDYLKMNGKTAKIKNVKVADILPASHEDADPDKWLHVDYDPDINIDEVYEYVANGGSLTTYCRHRDMSFGSVMRKIRKTPELEAVYNQALKDRVEWTVEAVLAEIKAISFSNVQELYNDDGSIKPPSEWPDEAARAVEAVQVDEIWGGFGKEREQIGETKRVKLWSKAKGVELLGKHHKLFVDQLEVSGKISLEDLLLGTYNSGTKDIKPPDGDNSN